MNRSDIFTKAFTFKACREEIDENGIWNPIDGAGSFNGGLQINLYGNREKFLELSRYFAVMAEIVDNHDHNEVVSEDGVTRLHFIIRADPDGR